MAAKSGPVISKWLYTEAQTGKGMLDTHFSYINTVLKSFVEDGNNCTTEEQIFQGLKYLDGIAGSSTTLLDGTGIPKTGCISKKFKSARIGCRATHEIQWSLSDAVEAVKIFESSDVTLPETITRRRLMQFDREPLNVVALEEFTSKKAPLYKKESDPSSTVDDSAPTPEKSGRAAAFEKALTQIEVPDIAQATDSPQPRTHLPDNLSFGWAKYAGNSKDNAFSADCVKTLVDLYNLGNDKKKKVSAERAHQILISTVLVGAWDEMLLCSVAKIKAFFALPKAKMQVAIAEQAIDSDDVYNSTRDIMLEEREELAVSLLDQDMEENGVLPDCDEMEL